MHFKHLELTGFKSFADRTILSLDSGITAVVGPNGCGKSNILDAMKWCLGEQRAKELRGSHMQDVIFNGSENRSAAGMAEVTVTFDNADSTLPVDFAEVAVTRRVYRSGESEYLINKAPCRLRDVHELFMDTGIGTNAYSMVGQGKMAMILSSKPDDRRYLFEEAAGIIKYKNRKRAAMRRLDSAEQNLLRLKDIIAEVQRQMRSLKRQVNAAIRYRELSEQLRDLEIRASWLKHVALTAAVAELKKTFAEATDQYEGAATRTTELEARFEELGLAKLEVDRVLLARREGVHEIDTEMERIEREIALIRQQVAFSNEQEKRAVQEGEDFEKRAHTIQDDLGQTDGQAEKTQEEMRVCTEAIEAKGGIYAEAGARVADIDAQLESKRAQAVEKMNTRAKTVTELETVEVSIAGIDAQLEAIYGRQHTVTERRDELLVQLEALRADESGQQKQLAETETQRSEVNAQQAEKTDYLRNLDKKYQDLRETKSSLDARLTSLRELRDSYEGFATGVRAVMAAKTKGMPDTDGIIGPVGDLLSTQKDYEKAIEAALGGNINNVVAEDADSAKAGVRFLKENRAGRVTFLPLDILRSDGRDHGKSLKNRKGVIGSAIDFVEYEPRIRTAVEYLLRDTLVVQTLDDAIQIAREEQRFPRLVTLDGEMVAPSGAVTGGSNRHQSRGVLGRSAEIAELEERVESTQKQLKALADEGQTITEAIQELTEHARELGQSENTLRTAINALGVSIARASTELDNHVEASQNLDTQRDELCAKREALEERRHEATARVDSMTSDDEILQNEIGEVQEAASHARQALSECASELGDLRVQQAGLAQRLQEIDRDREREQRQREEALEAVEHRRETVKHQQEERVRLENEAKLQVERSKALSENKEEARAKVIEAENQRQTLLDESDVLEKDLRELREKSRETQSRVHQTELALRQNEDRVEFHEERILTEYNIALASLKKKEVGTDEYEEAERDKLVSDLRARIQRMGEVNLMAIEEYDALEKRDNFLVTQFDDLQQARETLLDVIARSDKRIREMFMDTFERICDFFRQYFRHLFNGGQARIYLLDEDDPLESGIEIEARPPGKKPQSISLLSGGEQALTAMALLFSIFKAKPSPFCVLDEVDAPLDDANIGRFLKMLDEFVEESQFIVITHSKQTMARADVLYGVTMQERGVSQMVSVKFNEAGNAGDAA
jgi:chromosome segregation protein